MQTDKINKLLVYSNNHTLPEPSMEWIYKDEDPMLKTVCEPLLSITDEDLFYIDRMVSYVDTCYNEEYNKFKIRPGIAIAAPQVGYKKRVIYVHFEYKGTEYKYLLANPEIVSKSQVFSYIPNGEGCLSVTKDVKCNIPRNYKIIVKGIDLLTGQEVQFSAVELLSICLQHEIDHLDGIVYTDRINKEKPKYINPNWFPVE